MVKVKDATAIEGLSAGGEFRDGEDDGGLNLDDGVMAVDEEDEDDVDASALANKLGKKGVSLELKAETGAKKKKAGAGAAKKKPAKKPKAN